MIRPFFLINFLSILFFSACNSNEIGSSADVNTDAIYFDYAVKGEEGRDDVTINLQYRMGGPNGTTLVLDNGSQVTLDGVKLDVDSAKFYGAFYEAQRRLEEFSGKHRIEFTHVNGKKYEEEFEYLPFSIQPDVPSEMNRGDLVFNLTGLEPVSLIRVTLIDTSFESADINRVDTVVNGKLVIKASRLEKITNGPIYMQLEKTIERPVKNGTQQGGKLLISYGLKRQFELKD